ncbi:MAG: metalloregulator ArsR/SmtB family transcription factor [Actinomycetota bacterium]|nr:metalloregulator ArsR/SmtB family transcription factor [Actinomycetota bacterium]
MSKQSSEWLSCCTPLAGNPLSPEEAAQLAGVLKALADPVRLRIVSLVLAHQGGEACVCELTPEFDLTGPTLSHHLKVLYEAGVLDRERRGTWVYYRAVPGLLARLGELLAPPAPVSANV